MCKHKELYKCRSLSTSLSQIFKIFYLLILRGGREEDGERNTDMWLPPVPPPPTAELGPQPRHVA